MKNITHKYSLLVLFLLAGFLAFTIIWAGDWKDERKVVVSDATYYYSYLPAFFIHADPAFNFAQNDTVKYGGFIYLEVNELGRNNVRTTMGVAYLYAPFFFIGHALAHISGDETDGYSAPYRMMLLWAGVFYLILGLVFLRKILLRYYSDIVVALALLLIVLATNLFYYSAFENSMSHVYSFFMLTVFLHLMLLFFEKPSRMLAFSWAFIFGIIVLMRPSNILFAIIPIFWGIINKESLLNRIVFYKKNFSLFPFMIFGAILPILPQMLYWYYVSGSFIHYSYPEEARFYFDNPHILKGLFSFRKGWFLYTPIMLPIVLSIFLLKKSASDWFLPILIFVLINTYIIFSWPIWWYGGGFGQRAFVDSYPLLIFPLATLIQYIIKQKKVVTAIAFVIISFFVVLNLFQTRQYRSFAIHWDSMTKEAYFANFGKMQPIEGIDTLFKAPDYDNAWKNMPERKD
jgi:hypothetical protein